MIKPYPRCYWVEPSKLLAGYYPGDVKEKKAYKKIQSLLKCGIQCFINLTDENETNQYGNYFVPYNYVLNDVSGKLGIESVYMKIPIIDQKITNVRTMQFILDTIDNAIKNNLGVYIHCWGGIGRTGTIVGCWLIRHGKANKDNVLDIISGFRKDQNEPEAFREAPETQIQKDFIKNWKEGQ